MRRAPGEIASRNEGRGRMRRVRSIIDWKAQIPLVPLHLQR